MFKSKKISSFTFTFISIVAVLTVQPSAMAQYEDGNIFSSARAGDMKRLANLLKNKNSPGDLNKALGAAVAGDKIEAIKMLLEYGADINHLSDWDTPLLINAIMYGHYAAAIELIKSAGVDINVRGYQKREHGFHVSWDWTPLMCAARQGNIKLIKLLVKKKADVNALGWSQSPDDMETCADVAAYSGHLKALKFLLKKKAKINAETIYKATRGGHLEVVKFLLSKEKNINRVGATQGKTLLNEACWWGHLNIVRLLLEKGADVNKIGKNQTTPLMTTQQHNHLEIIKLLKKYGAK